MSKPAQLELTGDDLTALHSAYERTRSSSTTVTVNKEQLRKLLMDHGKLLAQDSAYRRVWARPVAA